jgi:hypothetical protein
MLTENQQQFINKITGDFDKLNSQPSSLGFGLDEIVAATNARQKKIDEYKIKSRAMCQVVMERFESDFNKIKEPLEKMGFKIDKVKTSHGWPCVKVYTSEPKDGIGIAFIVRNSQDSEYDSYPFRYEFNVSWLTNYGDMPYSPLITDGYKNIDDVLGRCRDMLKRMYERMNIKK